ncbi:protein downstream neighbor of son homolog [Trichogramma pretiosum]|uniref:protein downstream neighbor of son homolog n=1 Tax=Trichogramma pretiosum TaxID=7493 RepID=UPI0006C97B71|nr:protein downstream neighbor of son homolog [Trichogramma pretiosum]
MEESPGQWTNPDQVMKMFKLKRRKAALTARFNSSQDGSANRSINNGSSPGMSAAATSSPILNQSFPTARKRKNPWLKQDPNKRPKEDTLQPPPPSLLDSACGDSTFDLLNLDSSARPASTNTNENCNKVYDIIKSSEAVQAAAVQEEVKGSPTFPVNWSLKTRMRLMSPTPFGWKGKPKASEEASGTTGFVRCLNIGEQETTIDTSPNARFHQCCLVWQHPYISGRMLYPRSKNLVSVSGSAPTQDVREALYKDWRDSFRSLFHLLRVRQCPFFYVCGSSFTALFRAAGICGISEVQALMTPTTRGLRESMESQEIEFTMPLKTKTKKTPLSILVDDDDDDDDNLEQLDIEGNDEWMKSIGFDEAERRKINFSQSKVANRSEADIDSKHESLIFATGVEATGLFNFLINCKTIITCSGPFAGIPPTLLSPVAFNSATLRPLTVRESTVTNGLDKYHSLELSGPILPFVLPSLCSLMATDQMEKFSITYKQELNTVAFSLAKHGLKPDKQVQEETDEKLPSMVFGLENLNDCGFNKRLLEHFCNPNPENIQNFDSLTCENRLYNWT